MEVITIIGKTWNSLEVLGYCEVNEEETEFDIERTINRLWNEGGAWFENRDDLHDYSWRYGRWTEEELVEEAKADDADDVVEETGGKFIPLKITDPETGEVIVEEIEE